MNTIWNIRLTLHLPGEEKLRTLSLQGENERYYLVLLLASYPMPPVVEVSQPTYELRDWFEDLSRSDHLPQIISRTDLPPGSSMLGDPGRSGQHMKATRSELSEESFY